MTVASGEKSRISKKDSFAALSRRLSGLLSFVPVTIPYRFALYEEIRLMGSRRRGSGRRKVGRKKRRMRAKIRHRK
jgi:hypothetical protein